MRHFSLLLCTAIFSAPSVPRALGEQGQVYGRCSYPQPYAPQRLISPTGGDSPASAWNGREFGTVYTSNGYGYFQRTYADGTPAAAPVVITTQPMYQSALVWNGTQYGVVFSDWSGANSVVRFILLSATGAVVSGPVTLSVPDPKDASYPAIAWGGGNFMVAWTWAYNMPTSDYDIHTRIVSASGTPALSVAAVASSADSETSAAIAWNATTQLFWLTWLRINGGANEIWGARMDSFSGTAAKLVSGISSLSHPFFLFGGSTAFLAGNAGAVLRIGAIVPQGSFPTTVTTTELLTRTGCVVFSARGASVNGEFGVVWLEDCSGTYTSYTPAYARVSSSGVLLSSPSPVGDPVAYWNGAHDFAFGERTFLIGSASTGNSPEYLGVGGCEYESSPPNCAGNYLAYNLTGTGASLSWTPGSDPESGVAYYKIYRNNALIGTTSNEFYNDSGLTPGATYNYAIQPVNGYGATNTGCVNSVYVRTNSSLTLTMSKATASDAGLAWTDAGFNSYNIFRGNSPQVMSQIGQTPSLASSDPGSLNAPLSFFYSVDNPGP